MKILHLISGGDIGGAKTHIEALLPNLNKIEGVDARLLCVMEGEMTKRCRELGVSVTVIPQNKRYDLSAVKKIAKWIKAHESGSDGGFDIIHCHGARANFIALFLRFFVKTPMITTLHSDYRQDFKGGGYRQLVYMPLNALSLKRFKHFITVSGVFKQMLIERGFDGNQIDVIHNGVSFDGTQEISEAEKLKQKSEFLREHAIVMKEHESRHENPVIIGSAIRLHPAKGADILLKAAKIFFDNRGDALFLIAGDGAERKALESYIEAHGMSHRVKLLGFMQDIDRLYSIIDIHVLPSVSEGFAIVLLEGAKHRLNTVASRVGGIPEVITENTCEKPPNDTGVLFEAGNANELADILAREVCNPQIGAERGLRLYNDVKERFSDIKMAEKHILIYKKVLKQI